MSSQPKEYSNAYRALQMAKLYKALGSRSVAKLRAGNRVDALTGQFELDPVYITSDGLQWLREAEALIAESERDSVSLDDLALAFEATYKPSEDGWCERGASGTWKAHTTVPQRPWNNATQSNWVTRANYYERN